MSFFCCGREQLIKKKPMPPVYMKQKTMPKLDGIVPLGSSKPEEPEYLTKDNDFKAVEEEQKGGDRFVLKKLQRCGYD